MSRFSIGTGVLAGSLLTTPLIDLMYLADKMVGLPFVPFDLFDWIARVLPGPIITFGIDLMIDIMRLFGASVADTAKTAEKVMAILQFFAMGVVVGVVFFAVARIRGRRPDLTTGLVAGALVGLPMIGISIAIGGSDVRAVPRAGRYRDPPTGGLHSDQRVRSSRDPDAKLRPEDPGRRDAQRLRRPGQAEGQHRQPELLRSE